MAFPRLDEKGDVVLSPHLTIPRGDFTIRVTTSGGPGGQHANRSLTKVVVTFDVEQSAAFSDRDRAFLLLRHQSRWQASSSAQRSQARNRDEALLTLARRLNVALVRDTPRRATRATKGSQQRRVDSKKARGDVKRLRGRVNDD